MDERCCEPEPRSPISRTKSWRGVCSTSRVVSCREEAVAAAMGQEAPSRWMCLLPPQPNSASLVPGAGMPGAKGATSVVPVFGMVPGSPELPRED